MVSVMLPKNSTTFLTLDPQQVFWNRFRPWTQLQVARKCNIESYSTVAAPQAADSIQPR